MLRTLHDGLYFGAGSNIRLAMFPHQRKVLERVQEELVSDPVTLLQRLAEIPTLLARPVNTFLYLATDAEQLVSHYGSGLPLLANILNTSKENTRWDQQQTKQLHNHHRNCFANNAETIYHLHLH